ncbi:MAG: hypothetical protein LBL13_01470 [Bacteroidales bacterium]|jgi:hypothetical protein|nr:hypothetical protein [Bacteroidales bacterium]
MKKYKFSLLIFIFVFFCNGSCKEKMGEYFITIQNNSDKEIICIGLMNISVAQDSLCIKPTTKFEYEDFIYNNMIKPYSSRKIEIDMIVKEMQIYPDIVWYIGVFNRIDMDTMSCEEFKQKYPIKKEWQITLADMEAVNWTLVYTSEE